MQVQLGAIALSTGKTGNYKTKYTQFSTHYSTHKAIKLRIKRHVILSTIVVVSTDVSYVRDAALELLADESFHLPTKLNEICINAAKCLMKDLQTPSSNSEAFCNWIVPNSEK